MMFNSLDIALLRGRVDLEEREEAGQGFVALLDARGDLAALVRQD